MGLCDTRLCRSIVGHLTQEDEKTDGLEPRGSIYQSGGLDILFENRLTAIIDDAHTAKEKG